MQTEIHLRQMRPTDSTVFTGLVQDSPDTGQMGVSAQYQLDAYQVISLRYNDTIGVVARANEFDGLVGAGLVSFDQCNFEGSVLDYALLHSLIVHPDYRRRGIATELTQWRLRCAQEKVGEDGLIVASIQQGNAGSIATAQKWCQHWLGPVKGSMTRMRTKPPSRANDVLVRSAQPDEFEETAYQQNQFYREYNFYKPETPETLTTWLATTPFDTPLNHYLVAVDRNGNILAGLSLTEQFKLVAMQIERMSVFARVLNRFLAVVPPDGSLRQVNVSRLWYAPGQLAAARYLWEMIRWEWRDRGSVLVCYFDPRGTLPEVLRLPVWMPTSKFILAVRGASANSKERLVYW
jgi:GNAT superfamily N-acetyltransferase